MTTLFDACCPGYASRPLGVLAALNAITRLESSIHTPLVLDSPVAQQICAASVLTCLLLTLFACLDRARCWGVPFKVGAGMILTCLVLTLFVWVIGSASSVLGCQ